MHQAVFALHQAVVAALQLPACRPCASCRAGTARGTRAGASRRDARALREVVARRRARHERRAQAARVVRERLVRLDLGQRLDALARTALDLGDLLPAAGPCRWSSRSATALRAAAATIRMGLVIGGMLASRGCAQVPGAARPAGPWLLRLSRGLLFVVQVAIGLGGHVELQLIVPGSLLCCVISTSCSVTMRGSAAMPLTNAPIEWKLPVRRILIGSSA